MNERIKQIREALNMSQKAFAEKMSLGRDVISNIEYGRTEVKEYVSKLICTAFGVSEEWLNTGDGEMFKYIPKEDNFTALLSEVEEGDDELIKNFIKEYMKLSEENKKVIKNFGYSLFKKQKE